MESASKPLVFTDLFKQLIKPEITKCDDCPYCQYDSYYSMSMDSGYDCKKLDRRIIDDSDMIIHKDGINVQKNEPIQIPDWCPLPNKRGFLFR